MMNINGEKAAPLIAEIGNKVNMNYSDLSSGATNSALANVLKSDYGLPCDLLDYEVEENIDKLRTSLLNEFPVILSSRGKDINGNSLHHSFYADSYKRFREVTEYKYVWVYDKTPPDDVIIPQYPTKFEYTYTTPIIDMIGINWGWGPQYNQPDYNGWYSLTGEWITANGNYNYNYGRQIIYFPLSILVMPEENNEI